LRFIIFLFLGFAFIGLQTTLSQALPQWIGLPDFLFLLIVFIAIHFPAIKGATLVLIFGVLVEAVSGYFLGIYTIAYLLIFFIIKGLAAGLAIDEANLQPPIVAIGYLLANGVIYMCTDMLATTSLMPWNWGEILQRLLIITILTVPVSAFLEMLWGMAAETDDRHQFSLFQSHKGNHLHKKKR
jgi:rod shape-determining protein MreD